MVPELGVHVLDLQTGRPVLNYEANRGRIIASNTKLFTTAAALDRLGPGYQLETWVLGRGEVKDGVLQGDLAVVGGGDPNISGRHHFDQPYAVFHEWARELKGRGIRQVAGKLVLVDGLFSGPLVHPDWPRDQLDRWYEAPVAALSFHDNCVWVEVWPGPEVGDPARVEILPAAAVEAGLISVRSTAATVSARSSTGVRIRRDPGSPVVEVSGRIALDDGPEVQAVTVEDPVAFFGAGLRQAFEEEGVTVPPPVSVRSLPAGDWRRLTAWRSDLLTTVDVTNQRSQNFYAESLLRVLGARTCRRGTVEQGLAAVAELLDEVGLERGSYAQADGSGMSRGNIFTARQVTSLLVHMFRHRWGKEFLASLPFSGDPQSGWRRRLAEPPYRGNVFAKTGTLNGVSTLSGYAKGKSGRLYAFSILCNGVRSDDAARRVQDGILRALIDQG